MKTLGPNSLDFRPSLCLYPTFKEWKQNKYWDISLPLMFISYL